MRTYAFLIALCVVTAAPGQNSDFGFLFGVSTRGLTYRDGVSKGEIRVALQLNYARQLVEGHAGRLYLEVPVQMGIGTDGITSSSTFEGRLGASFFFTPGLRYHYHLTDRWAVYVAGGVGGAVTQNWTGMTTGRTSNFELLETRTSPAANFGGGLDFRLTRLWSIRIEGREFRSRKFAQIPGRSTVFQFGFGIHF
jgi:opacity protein-like surface antigen